MTTFSNKFKNTIFGAFSPYFWEKKVFSKNLPLVHSTTWASVSENNNETIPRKLPDRQTNGGRGGKTDRETIIHWTTFWSQGIKKTKV